VTSTNIDIYAHVHRRGEGWGWERASARERKSEREQEQDKEKQRAPVLESGGKSARQNEYERDKRKSVSASASARKGSGCLQCWWRTLVTYGHLRLLRVTRTMHLINTVRLSSFISCLFCREEWLLEWRRLTFVTHVYRPFPKIYIYIYLRLEMVTKMAKWPRLLLLQFWFPFP